MTTLLFRLDDARLKEDEWKKLLEISHALYARDRSPAREVPDLVAKQDALPASRW